MGWIGVIVDVLVKLLKGIFGTDKPAVTEVEHAKPENPLPNQRSDDELLAECGLRSHARPENENSLHDSISGEAVRNSGTSQGKGAGY